MEARVPNSSSPGARARHARQARFVGIGAEGQEKIARSRATIVGLGALGSVIAETLARAGVGSLGLIDRDTVEETNLQRQVLYDEEDAREALPKAEAARRAIARIDSGLRLEAHVEDLTSRNADRLLSGSDVILDGTDNFATRYLINDFAVERKIPGCTAPRSPRSGLVLAVIPNETALPALRVPEPSPPEETQNLRDRGHHRAGVGNGGFGAGRRGAEDPLRRAGKFAFWNVTDRPMGRELPGLPCAARSQLSLLRAGRAAMASRRARGPERGPLRAGAACRFRPRRGGGSAADRPRALRGAAPGVERHNSFHCVSWPRGIRSRSSRTGGRSLGNTTDPSVARALYARYIGS